MNYYDLLIEILNMTPEQRSQKVKVADRATDYHYVFGYDRSDCTDVYQLEDVPNIGPVLFQR